MSIEWLEAEGAIDDRLSLNGRREKLEAAVKHDPADAVSALQLASVLDQLGVDPQTIARTLDPSFQASPKDPGLMGWLGLIAYRMGELKLAMLTAKASFDLDPRELLANLVLANVLVRAGKFNEALKHAQTALEVSQASHLHKDIQRLYCIVLARLQKFEQAYQYQLQVLAERPDDSQAIEDTADLLGEMARKEEATALLLSALQRKPLDTDLLFRTAVGYFEDGNAAQALGFADRLLAADGQHLEGWNLRAQIKLKLGNAQGALADHQMILELSKKMPLDYAFVAECHLAMGRKDEAIAALKLGIEEVKDWPQRRKEYEAMLQRLQVQPPSAQPKGGPRLSPNDPCWCGSGKKLKKCHGQ